MKELYKSPVISVEELEKFDVLCASGEGNDFDVIGAEETSKIDNAQVYAMRVTDISSFL